MKHDYHIHTYFSGDSDTIPRDTVLRAISLGLETICITEHNDIDFPDTPNPFLLDTEKYIAEYTVLQKEFADKIDIRIGVELGLQPHLKNELTEYAGAYPFDFIIGSTHLVDNADPYFPEFWANHASHEAVIRTYLEDTLNSIRVFNNFDVLGHLDYIIRYCPNKEARPEILDIYSLYPDIIDEILRLLIANGKGIEVNTGALKGKLNFANPHPKILRRYRELGGEILTTGSDGHRPEHIAYAFDTLPALLKDCGFEYTTIFKNRKPEFVKI